MIEISDDISDGIKELVNIGIGKAAGSLNSLTGKHVILQVPKISLSNIKEIQSQKITQDTDSILINQDYEGAYMGTVILILSRHSAENLFFLLTGEKERSDDNEELWRMTLLEVGNIMINAIMGSISNVFKEKIVYHLPEYHTNPLHILCQNPRTKDSKNFLMVNTQFSVQSELIDGEIEFILSDSSIEKLTNSIFQSMNPS